MKNKEQKRKLGPGTYDVNDLDFVDALSKKPTSTRGICSTREERFRKRTGVSHCCTFLYGVVAIFYVTNENSD